MAISFASGPGRSMEKFRARRKSGSGTQRRWSTSSRCMIAICPAGPPKLMKPSFSQNRNASAKLTPDTPSGVGGVDSCVAGDWPGSGTDGRPLTIVDVLVDRGPAAAGEKDVQHLPTRVEGSCVCAFLRQHSLVDHHASTVDHVYDAGLPDRDVQALPRSVEPDGVRFTADRHALHLLVTREIDHDEHARVAGDERTIRTPIEIKAVRTSRGHADLRC